MARPLFFAAAIFSLIGLSCSGIPASANELVSPAYVPDEVIIKFSAGTTRDDEAALLARMGGTIIRRFQSTRAVQVRLSGRPVRNVIEDLGKNSLLAYVEPNYIVQLDGIPDDPDFALQWGLENTGQAGGIPGADISGPFAWDVATAAETIVVAIVDSGVDYNHPDLAPNIFSNPGEIPANGLDDDGNGYIDDVRGWNFFSDNNEVRDLHGHGTAIAGIIGAVGDNGAGVAGICWSVQMMPVKWCAYHSGNLGDAIAAIEYAALMNVDVMNLSWGFDTITPPQSIVDACTFASDRGILLVCAAGNHGHDLAVYPHFPGCLPLPLIVNAAASNQQDFKSSFSNYGRAWADLAAPGCGIYSTLPQGRYGLFGEAGPYIPGTGTSFAAPFVAGALALVKATYPSLTPAQVKVRLLNGVDVIPALTNVTRTGGRLNLRAALQDLDTTPPGPVHDLQIQEVSHDWVILTWTAAGDDGDVGQAADYLVRCSISPIDAYEFDALPAPSGQYLVTPADKTFSLRIDGLQCATRYFFAIKAVDDAENQSEVRQISATTLGCPPRAQLSVTQIQAAVTGPGTATREFILSNPGDGSLQYEIRHSGADWLIVEPSGGWLEPGAGRTVTLVCDAADLCSGTHTAAVTITCNDPDRPVLGLPVLLQVTGTPRIAVSTESLHFPATDVGSSSSQELILHNLGCEPLLVSSLGCEFADFTVEPACCEVAAGDSQMVRITFSPACWEPVSAQLIIHSNDPAAATVAVGLTGESPPPPALNLRNVPNPFNPVTEFRFNLLRTSDVQLRIYSLKGETVCTLRGGRLAPGPAVLNWDGRDGSGHPVGSGAYIYRLYLGGKPVGAPRKLTLLR